MIISIALALAVGRDLQFERVMVEFVAESRTVRSLEQVLPTRQARLIRLLGSADGLVRELAEEELRSQGRDASLALAWGMRTGDATIRDTSARLRDYLYRCSHCGGSGRCPACKEGINLWDCPERCRWNRDCVACDGTGDIRYEIDRNAYPDTPVLRDLFKPDFIVPADPVVPGDEP